MATKGSNNKQVTHESAQLHVTGKARFIDDKPEIQGTLFAAFVLSSQAHAKIDSIDLSLVISTKGVVDVITANDIKGENAIGPILLDEPLLANNLVSYIGQPILLVVANSYLTARKAARKAKINYTPLAAILESENAHQQQSYVAPPMYLDTQCIKPKDVISDIEFEDSFVLGGQEHFYLEGQITTVVPQEDGCFDIYCSTQHPTEMQHLIAKTLVCNDNQIRVEMRRMGGGFGGKESQSAVVCCMTAVAAQKLQKPIKCRLDRDDDMMITGKRHPFSFKTQIKATKEGVLNSYELEMLLDCGFSADLSTPVAGRALCHSDNSYFLPRAKLSAYLCKTNKQSNTAFRGFGGPQGAFAIEYSLDTLARELGLDALDVRFKNFYQGQTQQTPYGQVVDDNVIHELVTQLEKSSDYRARRQQIAQFNKNSPIIKKGLALTPVKFGISFNVIHFNQAGALVHIYTDGSVLVNHGGTEMGQGLHTKVAQIVASELGLDVKQVKATATDTSKVANTSATAASTGSDLNAMAALDATVQLKQKLLGFLVSEYNLDRAGISFSEGRVTAKDFNKSFKQVIQLAYTNRVQLWSDGFYKTPDIHWDHESFKGSPFYYYAYGAAVSEVAVDTLTGEASIMRADILHDAGQSINPDIDIGQIEGAYLQGVGWLTNEELKWDKHGRLLTHAPSTYKIPAVSDCPNEFKTELFENRNKKDSIRRSKAVGEPPILLAFSVFFAIRDAISSVTNHQIQPLLNAPATAEEILNTIHNCQQKQNIHE